MPADKRSIYGTQTNTGTQAGTVATESYFLIDKETNLPMRSEIVSQSTSGGNVQGVKGARLLTEMTDVRPQPDPNLFNIPTDFQKIDPEQVKAQANLIFNTAAAVIGQLINQAKLEAPKYGYTWVDQTIWKAPFLTTWQRWNCLQQTQQASCIHPLFQVQSKDLYILC